MPSSVKAVYIYVSILCCIFVKRLSKEEAGASSFSLRWQAVAIVAFLHIHVSPLAVFNTLSVARGACSRARPTAIQLWRQASMNSTRQNK